MILTGLIYLVACDSDKGVLVYNAEPTVEIISHENGSEILFEIDFIAKNSFTGKVINLMFERVFSKYIFAFESRANKLYS